MNVRRMLKCKKNKLNIVHLTAFLLICCIVIIEAKVYAASSQIEIVLPVEQIFSSTLKQEGMIGNYELVSTGTNTPMPAESADGKYTFSLSGNESRNIGPICFDEVGIYTYEMKQVSVNKEEVYTKDDKIYTIEIYVQKDVAGNLVAEIIMKNNQGYKVEILTFTNGYLENPKESEEKAAEVKTGDSSNTVLWIMLLGVAVMVITVSRKSKEK